MDLDITPFFFLLFKKWLPDASLASSVCNFSKAEADPGGGGGGGGGCNPPFQTRNEYLSLRIIAK